MDVYSCAGQLLNWKDSYYSEMEIKDSTFSFLLHRETEQPIS